MPIKIVFLDDDKDTLDLIQDRISKLGYKASYFTDVDEFEKALDELPSIVVIDYYLGARTGIDIMKKVKDKHPISMFIIMSSQMSTTQLVDIINVGWGCFYINKDEGNNEHFMKHICNRIDDARRVLAVKLQGFTSAQKKEEAIKVKGLEILNIIDTGK